MLPVHPLERFSPSRLAFLFFLLLAITIVFGYWLHSYGEPLIHPGAPYGIVSFEWVWNRAGLARVTALWSAAVVQRAIWVTIADYAFLVFYSTLLAAASLLLRRRGVRGIAWLAWVVATCDALENTIGLKLLTGVPTDPWPLFMSLFAAIKFALLVIILIYLVSCLFVILLFPR